MHHTSRTALSGRSAPICWNSSSRLGELARKAAWPANPRVCLLGELTKLSERPSMAGILARNQARARATGSTVTMSDACAAVRAGRDRHET